MASLLTPAVDTRNINTFYGGINTVIDYILSQNPRARILVIGFYEYVPEALYCPDVIRLNGSRDRDG